MSVFKSGLTVIFKPVLIIKTIEYTSYWSVPIQRNKLRIFISDNSNQRGWTDAFKTFMSNYCGLLQALSCDIHCVHIQVEHRTDSSDYVHDDIAVRCANLRCLRYLRTGRRRFLVSVGATADGCGVDSDCGKWCNENVAMV